LSLKIFYDGTNYRLKGWKGISGKISEVIRESKYIPGDLNFILTSDENLRSINMEFLHHDYFTDVITFNYCEGKMLNGEIYISIDTVRSNALNYNVSLRNELLRVMIHGILHLTGLDDKDDRARDYMSKMEDVWLKRMEIEKL
jgi:rRNA maturation RNase YbeY